MTDPSISRDLGRTASRSNAVSLAHLSVGGTAHEFIEAASQARFATVGLRICARRPGEPFAQPLLGNDGALRELKRRAADGGVRVTTVNGYQFYPEVDWNLLAPIVDAAVVLGAARIMVNCFDPDLSRFVERVARYCEAAAPHGIRIALEFMPYTFVRTLDAALAVLDRVATDNAGIVVDALHLERSGGSPADIGRVPTGLVELAQLCDARAKSAVMTQDELRTEARTARLALGAGDLPLREFISMLPAGVELEYEVARSELADTSPLARALAARADVDAFVSSRK